MKIVLKHQQNPTGLQVFQECERVGKKACYELWVSNVGSGW
jgi:hypothetical protein